MVTLWDGASTDDREVEVVAEEEDVAGAINVTG